MLSVNHFFARAMGKVLLVLLSLEQFTKVLNTS